MELRQLRYFTVLADTLHFGRAAAAVHLAPSAFSTTIARLERELGVPLLERTSRTVRLTEAGQAFLPHAHAVLTEADRATATARAFATDDTPTLTIGLLDEGAAELNTPLLTALRARLPRATIRYRALPYGPHEAALADGEVDALIGMDQLLLDPGLGEYTSLYREGRLAMLPSAHALAEADTVSVHHLLDEPFGEVAGAPVMNEVFRLTAFRNGEPCRTGGVPSATMLEMLQLVAAGDGVLTVSTANERFFPYPGVTYRRVPDAPDVTVSLITRHGDERPVVAAMAGTAASVARRLIDLVPGATVAASGGATRVRQDFPP